MLYPAITGLWYARSTFHSWPDTTRLMAVLKPVAASRRPVLFIGEWRIFPEYYLGGGRRHWPAYSQRLLPSVKQGVYSAVVVRLRLSSVKSPFVAAHLAAPAAVLGSYKLSAVIVYKSTNPNNAVGAWAIWEHVR
jgi:hypothetical protein